MCIGMITISLTSSDKDTKVAKKDEKISENEFTDMSDEHTLLDDAGLTEQDATLQENNEDAMKQLIESYLINTLTCDLQALEAIVTQIDNVRVEELLEKQKLIETYENVECYTVDGLEEGSFLVYVYYELKFTGIQTAAPGLTRLYVVTDEKGSLRVDNGLLRQEIETYIEENDGSAEVRKIIDTVNLKLEEAIGQDEQLRVFYENLSNHSANSNGEDRTPEVVPTDEPIDQTEAINE